MNLDEANHRSARSVFTAAVEITDMAQRLSLLDEACGNDRVLRTEVDRLLAVSDEKQQNRLDDVIQQLGVDDSWTGDRSIALANRDMVTESPGETIGRYKLGEKIGECGMGVVYLAEKKRCQEPFSGGRRK